MFEQKGHIPGYTGHQRTTEDFDAFKSKAEPVKQIPGKSFNNDPIHLGYSGFIPGTKSEGVFGQTYGNATLASK